MIKLRAALCISIRSLPCMFHAWESFSQTPIGEMTWANALSPCHGGVELRMSALETLEGRASVLNRGQPGITLHYLYVLGLGKKKHRTTPHHTTRPPPLSLINFLNIVFTLSQV